MTQYTHAARSANLHKHLPVPSEEKIQNSAQLHTLVSLRMYAHVLPALRWKHTFKNRLYTACFQNFALPFGQARTKVAGGRVKSEGITTAYVAFITRVCGGAKYRRRFATKKTQLLSDFFFDSQQKNEEEEKQGNSIK